jgi:hypothetical protein
LGIEQAKNQMKMNAMGEAAKWGAAETGIEQWQKNGWRQHTYTSTQYGIGCDVHHHLLFEKDE